VFSCILASADEIYRFNVINEEILFGPSIDLICEFECAEMQNEYGLGALFPLNTSECLERI
jgi:hypothetical protein